MPPRRKQRSKNPVGHDSIEDGDEHQEHHHLADEAADGVDAVEETALSEHELHPEEEYHQEDHHGQEGEQEGVEASIDAVASHIAAPQSALTDYDEYHHHDNGIAAEAIEAADHEVEGEGEHAPEDVAVDMEHEQGLEAVVDESLAVASEMAQQQQHQEEDEDQDHEAAAAAIAAAEEAVGAVLDGVDQDLAGQEDDAVDVNAGVDDGHGLLTQDHGTDDEIALAAAAAAAAVQAADGMAVVVDQALLATAAAAAASQVNDLGLEEDARSETTDQHHHHMSNMPGIPSIPSSNRAGVNYDDAESMVSDSLSLTGDEQKDSLLAARRLKDRRRYATMSPSQRAAYNAHRRELYHKQGENARKRRRERERQRYHSLEGDEKKERNERRAQLERDRYNKLSKDDLANRNAKRRERAKMRKLMGGSGSGGGSPLNKEKGEPKKKRAKTEEGIETNAMDQLHGHVVVKHEDEAMLMHHAQDLHDPEDGVPPPLDAAVAVPEDIMADAVSAAAEVAEQVVNATAAAIEEGSGMVVV